MGNPKRQTQGDYNRQFSDRLEGRVRRTERKAVRSAKQEGLNHVL
jgi:hypothetical protein